MVLFTPKKLTFKGSKKQHQILAQTAYYQAGKIVVQTILPEQPPVALITLNTFGTTCSTSADTYIPIENIFNTQSCSFLESRLVSLYGGKAASLLIEYQQRFAFHDPQPFALRGRVRKALQSSASYSPRFAVGVRQIFARGLGKLGVSTASPQPTYDSSLSKSQPFALRGRVSKALQLYQYKSKICTESSTFDFVKVNAPSTSKTSKIRYKAKKDALWVSKQSAPWGILPRALLQGQKLFFAGPKGVCKAMHLPIAKQRTGKGSEAGITTETTFLNNVQSRIVDPSELTLLQNKKANGKARLVKTCFAGAGNNIFQSTLGNIEIQTATRLARIMVNYWNFYSLNKISPEINDSLFKNDAPFPKAYPLNALHNKAYINSLVNNTKLGNFPHGVARVARGNPPTIAKVNYYLPQYLQPIPDKGKGVSKTTNSVALWGRVKAKKGLYLPLDKLNNSGDRRRTIYDSLSLLCTHWQSKKGILPHALQYLPHVDPKGDTSSMSCKEGLVEQKIAKQSFAGQKPQESVAQESESAVYAKREYNINVWGIKLKVKDKISQGNIIYRVQKNLYFAIAQSKHSLKICENKNFSYNIQRLSVENIGNYSQLNNNNFQLLNSLQFSNLQRDRFYPNWFRLYLPDMEATEFLKNVANYYFSLGLQTLLFPSSSYYFTPRFARRVKTASPFLTFLNKNTRKEKYKLFIPNLISYSYCPPSSKKSSILVNSTSDKLINFRFAKRTRSWDSMKNGVVIKSNSVNTLLCKASAYNYYKLYPRFTKGLFFNVRFANNVVIPHASARENIETSTNTNQRFVRRFAPFLQPSVAVQLRKARESNFCTGSYETGDLPLQNSLQSLALQTPYPVRVRGAGVDYIKDPNFTKDQLDPLNVPFSLFLENQLFPLNYNSFSIVEKELLYNALVNSSFAKAFYLINQNRQLLDFLVDYLLRFQILRQHQILYLFSTLLLGGNKTA